MQFYSLTRQSPEVDFATATRRGQAPDRGLYFPARIPEMPASFLQNLSSLSLPEIAGAVMRPFTQGSLPDEVLDQILAETLSFDIPLVPLSEDLHVLELFHGPTLAFKDVGARFMSRCMGYFERTENDPRPLTVLVATSGDTGGAVASGFDGVPGVRVVILYPRGKVSPVQELQLTTCGENVSALEVEGSFDDCQRMVKEGFADTGLQENFRLTSANSINVARWLPQQIYYWWAVRQWMGSGAKELPIFVVPSGNFGNICAGLLAYHMGMPAAHFLAACNANDTVPRYLANGVLEPHDTVSTLSNAMDVAVPSNFGRILELFGRKGTDLHSCVSGSTLDDAGTVKAMQELYTSYGYTADPHTSVGFGAWKQYRGKHPGAKGILLSTAHPVKFAPTIASSLGFTLDMPPEVEALSGKAVRKVSIPGSFAALKEYLFREK